MKKIMKKLWIELFTKYETSLEEKQFINENNKIWKTGDGPINILVEGFLYSPTSVIEKARIAKALEEKLNARSLILLRGFKKDGSNVFKIYESFGFENFIMWWRKYFNIALLVKTFLTTFMIFKKCKQGDDLLHLEFDKIIIGDLIYDTLIRSNPQSYTVSNLNIKKHFRHIFRAYYSAELYKRIFEKYDIKAVVTSHNVYSEYGILCRIAYKYNADVFLKDMNVFKHYDHSISVNEHFLKVKQSVFQSALKDENIISRAEAYLTARFEGTLEQIDVKNAYRNKIKYQKKQLFELYNISNNSNKNIFVMAHAFSDAPHVGEELLFRDYYVWLVETLKYLSSVKGVNIFVKPHPSSYMWGETGAVEKILKIQKIDNINILPKDFNTNSIKDLGDCILTAQGTAGLEFSALGIPAIIAGRGYYSGFGICIESETKSKYFESINNISNIQTLSDEIIQKAKVLLYLSMQHLVRSKILPEEDIFPGDNFDEKYKDQYAEVANKLQNNICMKDDFYEHIYSIAKDNRKND